MLDNPLWRHQDKEKTHQENTNDIHNLYFYIPAIKFKKWINILCNNRNYRVDNLHIFYSLNVQYISKYYEKLYAKKFVSLHEMDKFLEGHKFPKVLKKK